MSVELRDRPAALGVAPSRILTSRAARAITRFVAAIVNPAISFLAGRRFTPLFGVLVHQGRRSRREYRTPVVMLPYGGGLVIPMTFGDHANWYRNIVAAGACRVRWRGSERRLKSPVVIEATHVSRGLSPVLRLMLAGAGIGHFLSLQLAD